MAREWRSEVLCVSARTGALASVVPPRMAADIEAAIRTAPLADAAVAVDSSAAPIPPGPADPSNLLQGLRFVNGAGHCRKCPARRKRRCRRCKQRHRRNNAQCEYKLLHETPPVTFGNHFPNEPQHFQTNRSMPRGSRDGSVNISERHCNGAAPYPETKRTGACRNARNSVLGVIPRESRNAA